MAIRFEHKPGLVVYLTAGDPSIEATRAIAIAAIDAGADVIELGVPFSDPLADGPVIQRAMERALARGTRLKDVVALAAEIRAERPRAGLVIFSYLNPILRYGLHRFADDAAAAGVDGVLATDLIVEEAGEYLAEMERTGLAPIFLAAPTDGCGYAGRAHPAMDPAADSRGVRHLDKRTRRPGGGVRGCGGDRQRDCGAD